MGLGLLGDMVDFQGLLCQKVKRCRGGWDLVSSTLFSQHPPPGSRYWKNVTTQYNPHLISSQQTRVRVLQLLFQAGEGRAQRLRVLQEHFVHDQHSLLPDIRLGV